MGLVGILTYTAAPSPRLQSATVANIEQDLRRTWERLPGVRQLEGLESAYFFVDRQRGKAIFISLWESEEAMNNSEEVMRPLRAEISGAFAANRVDVEHYEVGDMLVQEIRERELLEQELEVARSIQQASLPKEVPILEGWQIAPYYQPAREVGGDFYDFFELEDGRLGLVVGDASGKGIPAAMVMANTRSVVRTIAQRGGVAPGEVLAEANEVLYPDILASMFVTCFYGVLDPSSGSLSYANAGHDLPYRHR